MVLRKTLKWIFAVSLSFGLLLSCSKEDQPQQALEEPVIYAVSVSDFSTTRGDLKIGGKLYMPKGLEGKKPAVICCHGLTGSYRDTEIYAQAAATKGVVACSFDFCGGHEGKSLSDGDRAHDSILTEVEDLAAVYAEIAARPDIDPSKIMVMGGSQGGLVAALYAARNPAGVKALGLLFPAFNIPDLVRFFTIFEFGGLKKIPESVTVFGFTVWQQYVFDAYKLYPYSDIGIYTGPVLIVQGDKDELVPLFYANRAHELYNDSTLYVLEGQGHGFDADGKAQAIEYLNSFIDDVLDR